jgi:hypothetical protein
MSEENDNEVRPRSETVALTDSSSQKIDQWLGQIAAKRVRLSRKEFLNWFIEKSSDNLSNADLNAIVDRYYDEEVFLRQLLREVKQAKKDGGPSSLEVIVRQRKPELKRDITSAEEEEIQAQSDSPD